MLPILTELRADARYLTMRYSLHRPDKKGMTLSDISTAYSITNKRAGQLEELAIIQLKHYKDMLTAHLMTVGAKLGISCCRG